MPEVSLDQPEIQAFVVLPVLLVALLSVGVWRAWRRDGQTAARSARATLLVLIGAAIWMTVTWMVASSGALRNWNATPPPFALLIVSVLLLGGRLAFSTLGARLARHIPLAALVAVQAFRFPLEMAMHRLAERGIMPMQMTYTGLNFDIVTGITAVLVGGLAATGRVGRNVVLAWNVLGMVLLTNIVVIAILSVPRIHAFGEDQVNVFVTFTPFVWLPAVLVLAALAGHLIIFRATLRDART